MVQAKASSSKSTKVLEGNATLVALKKFKSPRQLFRGYTALLARNLPFTAMQFPIFEGLKKSIHAYRRDNSRLSGTLLETGSITAISAGIAGSVSAFITTPVDVVKTRMMLSASSAGSARPDSEAGRSVIKQQEAQGQISKMETKKWGQAAKGGRAGGFEIGREVLRSEGLGGLFRGATLRSVWTAIGSGLYLGVYESGRIYLENRRKSSIED